MKKLVFIAFAISLLCIAFCSCEPECKDCRSMTYDNGVLIDQTEFQEFCDADLDDINEGDSVTIGSTSEVWDCQ